MSATTDTPQTTLQQSAIINFGLRWMPPILFIIAAILLVMSLSEPYWEMHLDAPQYNYRGGLDIVIYADDIQGKDPEFDELRELNGLNHYIGMRHLDDAAIFERKIAVPSMIAFVVILVVVAGLYLTKLKWRRYAWILTFAPLGFPFVFVADLYYWLWDSGQNLDPTAPFSSTIKPFTPTLIGKGEVGQFVTEAFLVSGWYMAAASSALIVVALVMGFFHFRANR